MTLPAQPPTLPRTNHPPPPPAMSQANPNPNPNPNLNPNQAELPSRGALVSRLSPYALVVLEGCAARTSTASGATPLWLPEAARAFNLPVTSGCSSLHLALFDEVVREEAVKEEDVRGEVVARAREGQEGAGKGPEVVLEAVRGVEVEAGMEVEVAAAAAAAAAAVAETTHRWLCA